MIWYCSEPPTCVKDYCILKFQQDAGTMSNSTTNMNIKSCEQISGSQIKFCSQFCPYSVSQIQLVFRIYQKNQI